MKRSRSLGSEWFGVLWLTNTEAVSVQLLVSITGYPSKPAFNREKMRHILTTCWSLDEMVDGLTVPS